MSYNALVKINYVRNVDDQFVGIRHSYEDKDKCMLKRKKLWYMLKEITFLFENGALETIFNK